MHHNRDHNKMKEKLLLSSETRFQPCPNGLYLTVSFTLYLKDWILSWKLLKILNYFSQAIQGIFNCVVFIFLFIY